MLSLLLFFFAFFFDASWLKLRLLLMHDDLAGAVRLRSRDVLQRIAADSSHPRTHAHRLALAWSLAYTTALLYSKTHPYTYVPPLSL